MKKILFAAASIVLLSCTRETAAPFSETMTVSSSDATRISVDGSYRSVWDRGDEVSVFFEDLQNERWTYSGADKAVSGTITGAGRLRPCDTGKRIALYPYCAGYVAAGDSVSGPVPSACPLLSALSYEDKLHFSYLSAMVRVKLSDTVDIISASLRPYGDERFPARFCADFSGGDISCRGFGAAADSLVYVPGVTDAVTFNILPMSFSEGFIVRLQYADNSFQTVRYTQGVALSAGNLLELEAVATYFVPSLVLTVDFTRDQSPFQDFPESGQPDCTARSRRDSTYCLVQDGVSYPFKFHAGYYEYPAGHKQAGVKEYGYRISTTTKMPEKMRCLLIGRDSSYVRIPYVKGRHLRRIEAWTGNGSFGSRVALDSLGAVSCATFPSGMEPGDTAVVDMDYFHRRLEQPVYLFISSGNVVLLRWRFYYQ